MQFSNTTTRDGIVQDTSWLLFGDSEDHTAEYALKDVARNANRWYDRVLTKIFQADDRWEFDDNNKTDLPIGTFNLVSGQQDYGVSGATFLKIKKIDIKDAQGNNLPLKQFTLDQLRGQADANFMSTAGTPQYFRIQANSVFVYPTPNYSYTNGMRIFYQRTVDYFASTDTTKVPGFAEPFHRLLSLGAAYEYALQQNIRDKITMLKNAIKEMEDDLIDFYSKRNEDDKPSFRLSRSDYGEASLSDRTARGPYNNPNRFNF